MKFPFRRRVFDICGFILRFQKLQCFFASFWKEIILKKFHTKLGTFIMKEVTQVTHHQLRDHGDTFHRQSTPSYHVLLQILVVLVWKEEIVGGLLLQ